MSDFKTADDADVKEALDKGQPLPANTVYSPYNTIPDDESAQALVDRARGYTKEDAAKATKASKSSTSTESASS